MKGDRQPPPQQQGDGPPAPAPGYGPTKPGQNACANCAAFRSKDGVCTQFGFVADPNYGCKDWVSPQEATSDDFVPQMRANLPRAQTTPVEETPFMIEKKAHAEKYDMRGRLLAHSLWEEIEKIAKAQALEKQATAAMMGDAQRTPDQQEGNAVEETQEDAPDSREYLEREQIKSKLLAKVKKGRDSRKEKGKNDGTVKSAASSDGASPQGEVQQGGQQQMQQSEDQPQEDIEQPPAHGIVGTKVEQDGARFARGIPVIQPPPGFTYEPELHAFVPDPSNPGWMQAEQAMEAARNKSYYEQGSMDQNAQQAQQQMDQQVDQRAQMALQENAQVQQQQAQMGAMQQQAQQRAMNDAAKKNMMGQDKVPGTGDEPALGGGPAGAADAAQSAMPTTPSDIAGPAGLGQQPQTPAAQPAPKPKMSPKKKKDSKKGEEKGKGDKGIRIEIGR